MTTFNLKSLFNNAITRYLHPTSVPKFPSIFPDRKKKEEKDFYIKMLNKVKEAKIESNFACMVAKNNFNFACYNLKDREKNIINFLATKIDGKSLLISAQNIGEYFQNYKDRKKKETYYITILNLEQSPFFFGLFYSKRMPIIALCHAYEEQEFDVQKHFSKIEKILDLTLLETIDDTIYFNTDLNLPKQYHHSFNILYWKLRSEFPATFTFANEIGEKLANEFIKETFKNKRNKEEIIISATAVKYEFVVPPADINVGTALFCVNTILNNREFFYMDESVKPVDFYARKLLGRFKLNTKE